MSATPSRSHAFTPPPNSSETGIMPDLYRLSVGPLRAAYYQRQFQRFESLGKAVPTWNTAAACFTLAWMVLRKQWRAAGIYACAWLALVMGWALAIHNHVPLQIEAVTGLLLALLLYVVPGFLANGWYYNRVRTQTLDTLTRARSIGQARAQLAEGGIDRPRLYTIAALQVAVSLAALMWLAEHATFSTASARAPAATAPSGPPHLVFPTTANLPIEPAPTPSMPWMEPALPEASALPAPLLDISAAPPVTTAVDVDIADVESNAELLSTPAPMPAAAAPATPALETEPETPATSAPQPVAKRSVTPSVSAASPSAPKPAAASKSKPTSATTSAAAPAGQLIPGKYYLNAGVYAQAANVERAIQQLQAAKLQTVRQTIRGQKGDMTRLRIGPFDSRKQAEQAVATAQRLRMDTSVFQYNPK